MLFRKQQYLRGIQNPTSVGTFGTSAPCTVQYRDKFGQRRGVQWWSYKGYRAQVFERDHGICAICGIDAEKLRRIYEHASRQECQSMIDGGPRWAGVSNLFRNEIGIDPHECFWQVDHIEPKCRGGLNNLSNYRTLCTRCHFLETMKMRGFKYSEPDSYIKITPIPPPSDELSLRKTLMYCAEALPARQ